MKYPSDLTGIVFGRYTVISLAGCDSKRNTKWNCRCECGVEKVVPRPSLVQGCGRSCGCLKAKKYAGIAGQKFGYLTAIEPAGRLRRDSAWRCQCVCGEYRTVKSHDLVTGKIRSCGCKNRKGKATHDMYGTATYNVWAGIKQRCLNPCVKAWPNYGGRGISVCERWLRFENFLVDMGERPPGMSIDRIDNNGNYEPENCRWATPFQQCRNTRKNRMVDLDGESMPVVVACEKLNVSQKTVRTRILRGWCFSDAVKSPIGKFISRSSVEDLK